MKRNWVISIALLTLVVPVWPKDKGTNHADYPEKAHVSLAVFKHTTAPSNTYTTELQIGTTIYIADDICKAAVVGSDYPAKLEKNRIRLLVGTKVCKYRVVGTRDVPR